GRHRGERISHRRTLLPGGRTAARAGRRLVRVSRRRRPGGVRRHRGSNRHMRTLVILCVAVALLPLWRRPETTSAVTERIERFTEGRHEYTIRHIAEPSRRVHPAEECYRATGWTLRALPMRVDSRRWGCFEAAHRGERV